MSSLPDHSLPLWEPCQAVYGYCEWPRCGCGVFLPGQDGSEAVGLPARRPATGSAQRAEPGAEGFTCLVTRKVSLSSDTNTPAGVA